MPELPEVQTTVNGLKKTILNQTIKNVWTDLATKDKRKYDTVSNQKYFLHFKKKIVGKKIISVERIAKNILINLSGEKTILVHMKMTGHLLYGEYKLRKQINKWEPIHSTSPLSDSFNRFVHFVISFSNGKHLVFSDMRKFGKITLLEKNELNSRNKHLKNIGPDPLTKHFNPKILKDRLLKKPKGKIKTVLMDQSIIAGIGNIYSDEILWRVGILPDRIVSSLKDKEINRIAKTTKAILKKGINLGGDSMSDYRNIYGEKGKFQLYHKAYRRTKEKCQRKNCKGIIVRKIINGRSAHFCNTHQK
ncbi:MAG: DNA-formamidopyrimidine glycosylase [Candidatus Paceibacterota bacterium]